MATPLSLYIIAGEASGDLLGAHLMRSLKERAGGPVRFAGIGGEKMEAEGLASKFPYHELSMMGFIEILPYIFNLMARIDSTVEDILAKRPDIVVTIDSPGFNFRVVERLRKRKFNAKFVHYVAPTVWAYKPQRAARCAKLFDHMLLLLPFEPPYFEAVGLPCTFVGHPVIAETSPGDPAAFRAKYDIPAQTPLFCLLPGSRKGEVERHMPIFAQAIGLLAAQYRDLAIAVCVPRHVLNFVAPYFENCPFRAVITASDEDKKNAVAAANFALVKSGTVALEVALAGTPMLIAYRVNALSAHLLKRMILTRYVNLVNILEQEEIIPELLQESCTPLALAGAAAGLLGDEARRRRQQSRMQAAIAKLLPPLRPSDHAADVILALRP